jgi:quinol monooxygenase YgiN
MTAVIITYKVKPDQVETNKRLVQAVYDELHETQPGDTRYVTFQLEDGVSFVHLNWSERGDGDNALTHLAAVKRFQQGIPERVQEGPVVSKLKEVGAFRVTNED